MADPGPTTAADKESHECDDGDDKNTNDYTDEK